MLALLPVLLQFVATVAPMLTSSAAVAGAISTVTQALPMVIEVGGDLLPLAKLAIASIRGAAGTTTEQLDQLDVLEAKIDAAYDAASAKAKLEDDAADGAAAKPAT